MSTSVSTQGLDAPDTGISAHDYEVDRIVGADAKAKWERIAQRQRDKIRVMEENHVTGFDLSKTHDGGYKVMTPEQRAASERSRSFHFKMDAHRKKLMKSDKSP